MEKCLKEAADQVTYPLEKVCLLMWDEVSLKLMLQYSAEKDKVEGFEDWGTYRTRKYADHLNSTFYLQNSVLMMTLILSTDWTILINDVEIVPLYDPPHMLKYVRNNLLTKDLEFDFEENTSKENRKFARWDHVVKAYEVDLYAPRLSRMVPDLTDEHIYPDKIKKMSVKLMMQVFSKNFLLSWTCFH